MLDIPTSNTPEIEFTETATFPMLSNEIQNGDVELEVHVRLHWNSWEGLKAEPVAYGWLKGQKVPMRANANTVAMDDFVKLLVERDYTDEYLTQRMADDPNFEAACTIEWDMAESDRADGRSAVL